MTRIPGDGRASQHSGRGLLTFTDVIALLLTDGHNEQNCDGFITVAWVAVEIIHTLVSLATLDNYRYPHQRTALASGASARFHLERGWCSAPPVSQQGLQHA